MMSDLRRTDLEGLCRRILAGGRFDGHRLTRKELVRLWRSLSDRCPCRIKLSRLTSRDPRLHPAQIALGLQVLKELTLANVRLDGQDIDIMLIAWDVKTDLDRSPTWKKQQG